MSSSNVDGSCVGRVKWFNNKTGYGFISVTDGPHSGNDIFVHHSAINVVNQQYKYLVQGEYVSLKIVKTTSDKHELQGSDVSGINGGKLMCETRHETNTLKSEYKTSTRSDEKGPRMPRQQNATQYKQPREARTTPYGRVETKSGWSMVGKNLRTPSSIQTN